MRLTSNIFPIEIEFDEFQVQRLPWSEGILEELRLSHNAKYSFFRNGDFIYISPGEVDLDALGELVTLSVSENIGVVASLMRHIFFRAFKAKFTNIRPTFYPFTFPSRKDEHNLIKSSLLYEFQNSITYRKLNELSIRFGEVEGRKRFLLVIDSSYKWAIRENCLALKQSGMNLSQLEVARTVSHPGSEGVAAPSFEAIGRLEKIEGLIATVSTNSGAIEFPLDYLYLNKTRQNIQLYLEHKVGAGEAAAILSKVKLKEFARNDPSITYAEILDLAAVLANLEFKNFDGFSFRVASGSTVGFRSLSLENPKYLFDLSFTKVSTSPSSGLNSYGPYDAGKFFDVNSPSVLVIYHRNSSGAFTEFLGWLRDGLPNSSYFAKGMVVKYRLTNLTFHCVEIDQYTTDAYLTGVRKGLDSGLHFDIAIVETREDFKKLSTQDNPYWAVKAKLLQKGISVQYLKVENARKPDFIIDGFALQMYAKLGGSPWVLPASQNIAHEIIVGIGSSFTKANNFKDAPQSRVVGITTFFSADGRYLLNNRTREVSYTEYFDELLRNLKSSIDRISSEHGWLDNDIIRIVFHVFKPMKNVEVDVVAALIQQYPQFDIKFAFVSFAEHHPYMFFDLDQAGLSTRYSNGTKGKYVPYRGTNIVLDQGICLLQLKGPADIKTDKQGFVPPLMIKVHQNSTFSDLTYIVQQVFRLTNISYRTFLPSQLPVSLFYAQLITDQLNQLSQVPGWNPDFLRQLSNRKWFI